MDGYDKLAEFWQAFVTAIKLLVNLDPEVLEIAGRTLMISLSATLLASLINIPLGSIIYYRSFRGRRILINLIQTFFSIPTVVVGLFVFVFLSRSGPLGGLNLLFTPIAMVIGQMILLSPILLGLTISAFSGVNQAIKDTALSLGASDYQTMMVILNESRFAILGAITMGFGRAISEVGISLMVGGNISGFTRVITTAISLETQKGELELAIALGMILLGLALVVNIILNRFQQR